MKMLLSLMVSRKHKMSSGNDDDDDMSRTTNVSNLIAKRILKLEDFFTISK